VRAIIDTNVLLSGLLWHGPPHTLLDRVRDGTVTLISSPARAHTMGRIRL
jgi:predicted nucleic acid-binding protein